MLPIIVTGRRPTCWKCGKTGHLAHVCPEKMTSDPQLTSNYNAPQPPTLPATRIKYRITIASTLLSPSVLAVPLSTVVEWDWQVVVKGRRKAQTAARLITKSCTTQDNPTPNSCKGDASATAPGRRTIRTSKRCNKSENRRRSWRSSWSHNHHHQYRHQRLFTSCPLPHFLVQKREIPVKEKQRRLRSSSEDVGGKRRKAKLPITRKEHLPCD